LGRWNDEDDWRGWINGKYDNRYGSRKNRPNLGKTNIGNRPPRKIIAVIIVAIIIIGISSGISQQGENDSETSRNTEKENFNIPTPDEKTKSTSDIMLKPTPYTKLEPYTVSTPQSSTKKETSNSVVDSTTSKRTLQILIPKDDLYDYALELVNKDREKNGLSPVKLSNNQAAQIHADDILNTRTISHWMTNGEKPYMTYTRYDGTGYVGQNIAFGGYPDIEQCKQLNVICESIDPKKAIQESEYGMMYNDATSNWGHRDNIIDPNHTHVSFGFAYDRYSYALVQNFEDNYMELVSPIGDDPHDVRIIGNVMKGQIQNISIYYDQYPTSNLYQIHKDDRSYAMGELVAIVVPPLAPNSYYDKPSGYDLIVAKSMSQKGNSVDITFDMSSITTTRGVYTITVWLQNNGLNIPAISYTMFVE
jgi:uncharacterized protein YkwD